MKPLRVYADTSVFGGSFDAEFASESERFFDLVRVGRVKILVIEVVVRELANAPGRVRELLRSLPADSVEPVRLTRDVIDLRDAYLAAGILDLQSTDAPPTLPPPPSPARMPLFPGTSNISCGLTKCGLIIK